jgi:hypothetical protein
MSIKNAILSRIYSPKVKHRLPGRLRLNVPILKKIPRRKENLFSKFEKLFLLPDGIDDVKASPVSGSIVVSYNPEEIKEENVIHWVGTLWRLIGENYDRLAEIELDEIDNVISRIVPILKAELNENHSFDKQIRIPENVWS